MKVLTILGTRPEIIRLSRVIPILDKHADHVLVHTGQNYDERLSGRFFEELGIREPNEYLGVRAASFGAQIGQIMERSESVLLKHRPDRVLILGDTNSGMGAVVARRLGIPVYHMEAGNRCYDDRVPEEVNRRVIDHSSSILMPYTGRSRDNLLAEGILPWRIHVTGNPIREVIETYADRIEQSRILKELNIEPRRFFLVTLHRAENVDYEPRLRNLVDSLEQLHRGYGYPIIVSLHPRTRARIETFGVAIENTGLQWLQPLGFFDFVRLEQNAFCVLSDSGTVQEETCLFGVPNVTIRDVTERPETLDCGSNFISGAEPCGILAAVRFVTTAASHWEPPAEYRQAGVAQGVARIVLSFRLPDPAELQWRQSRPNANPDSQPVV